MTTYAAEPRPVPGVGVVVVEEGRLLMVRRGRPPGQGLWAVPGGKVGWGESLREAACREAREETGLEVETGAVAWAGEAMDLEAGFHFVLVDFFARVVGGELRAGDDAAEVAWVELTSARLLPMTSTMPGLIESLLPG